MPAKKLSASTSRPVTPSNTTTTPAARAPTTPSTTTNKSAAATTTTTTTSSSASSSTATSSNPITIAQSVWSSYTTKTTPRTKLIDAFMAFLIAVGVLQFVYCVIAGNYPFNAFLSGFSATVGQFVLTASLRMQSDKANQSEFPSVSSERAFADYVFGSLILHLFCTNFIN